MTLATRKISLEFGMCVDLALCGVILFLDSALIDGPLWATDTILLRHPLRQVLLIVALCFCWHVSLSASGAYRSYRIDAWRIQAGALARGATLATVWTGVWLGLSRLGTPVSAYSLLQATFCFWAFSLAALLVTRIGARLVTRFLRRHGRNLHNVLVVGSNRRAVAVADKLLADKDLGFRLAGFVDDYWHFEGADEHYKKMLLGPCSNIVQLLRTLELDEVIIALPIASQYQITHQIIALCREQGILVRCEGSLFDVPGQVRPSIATSLRLITLHDDRRDQWGAMGKRLIDLIFSATTIAALLPILAIIAVAIKLTSPGPILFSQERLGLGKRRFRIFKFRTMVANAEALMDQLQHLNQTDGPTFKLRQDPRITPIGGFLRKSSLDELPQLFNVFLGEMSLVGPRPLPLRDYRGFSEDWHRRRFTVKPGITCLWQVNGRSSVGFDRWMELDMDYIDRWSLWLDFKILIQTIPAVMRGSGAM
jgi:exopolysaccharide biosynthesis polyprenyl glycosylphosphotransferase